MDESPYRVFDTEQATLAVKPPTIIDATSEERKFIDDYLIARFSTFSSTTVAADFNQEIIDNCSKAASKLLAVRRGIFGRIGSR